MPAKEQKQIKARKWHQKWWGIILLIILALAIIIVASFIYLVVFYVEIKMQQDWQQVLTSPNLKSQNIIDQRIMIESSDDPFWGKADASLVIVEFSDFQCPFSAQAYQIIKSIRQQYADQIKIIYRDMPDINNHNLALDAAIAANCAHEQDKFWQYHDQLFENQANLSVARFETIAISLGLDQEQFTKCLSERKYEAEVKDDLASGIGFGVNATPTFFINGNKVPGVIQYSTFIQIINKIEELDLLK